MTPCSAARKVGVRSQKLTLRRRAGRASFRLCRVPAATGGGGGRRRLRSSEEESGPGTRPGPGPSNPVAVAAVGFKLAQQHRGALGTPNQPTPIHNKTAGP